MSRFERKCFIGSATFHGLLLVVFLFGSAFMSKDNLLKDMGPVVTIENVRVTDGPTTGGGNPNGNPNPTPPAPAPVQPEPPAPPPPKPEVAKPTPRAEPPKPEVVKVKDTPKPVEKDQGDLPVPIARKPTPPKPSLTAKTVTRNDEALQAQQRADAEKRRRDEIARANAEAARLKAERQRLADAVNGIVGGTGKALGKSTVVEPLGPGGAAFVNYGSLVGEIYKRAVYASQPQSDDDAQAHIRVVVARDGTVRSSDWVRRTGSSVLDKAVERAMNSVRSLPSFPPEAKDSERTFNIKIAFDAKKVSA